MLIYLDSSAVVKLCRSEDETDHLLTHLVRYPDAVLVSSVLATVEASRALVRDGLDPEAVMSAEGVLLAPAKLSRPVLTFEIGPAVLRKARTLPPVVLRSLDAIHVATAQVLGDVLDHVVAYDKLFLSAAAGVHLPVSSPGRPDLDASR